VTDGTPTRRECLGALSIPLVGALAGCGAGFAEETTPTPRSDDALQDLALFVGGGLSLSVPDGVDAVEDPADADVIVLPASTERSAATAVEWLGAGKRVALVGEAAQDTWLDWQDSDAYADAYPDHRGRANGCAAGGSGSGGGSGTATDCEPPELLVGWDPAEGPPTTYRKTWGGTDDPSDEQVFASVDAAYQ
jgi:hypothetical protein